MRCVRLLSVTLLALALTGSARAQVLHGQWFKATATADGASITGELEVTEVKFKKITHYLRFFSDEGDGSHVYGVQIWVENAGGEWVFFDTGNIVFADLAETYVADGDLTFYVGDTIPVEDAPDPGIPELQRFDVDFNGPSKVKLKGKKVKSAKIKSDGSLCNGSFDGNDLFVGGAKVSLILVPESKLPFDPTPVLKAGAPAPTTPIQPSWRSQAGEAAPAAVSQH